MERAQYQMTILLLLLLMAPHNFGDISLTKAIFRNYLKKNGS